MKMLYLGAIEEGLGPGGVRTLRLGEEYPGPGSGKWLAEVDPPVVSPEGIEHSLVLVMPWGKGGSIRPSDPRRFAVVGVGPAPGHEPAEQVGFAWYRAGVAVDRSVFPRSLEEILEEVWRDYQAWLEAGGAVIPDYGEMMGSVRIGERIAMVRDHEQMGLLPDEWVARFERVPGFTWWREDVIDWLERYAEENGTCRVPLDYQEAGRPFGHAVAALRRSYVDALTWEERLLEAERTGRLDQFPQFRAIRDLQMPEETRHRLERLPGWVSPDGPWPLA